MRKSTFDQLTESLEQAIDHAKGNRKAARTVTMTVDVPVYNAKDVAALRQKLHLTQRGLAAFMGVSPRTVEAWEAGVNQPSGPSRHLLYLLAQDERVLAMLKA